MRNLAFKLIVFFLVCYSLCFGLELFYEKKTENIICNKYDWIFSKHGETYDLAFLGSSRVFNMLNADTIEKLTNKKTLNLGFAGVAMQEQFLILKKLYQNNCRFKNLYLQLDIFSLIEPKLAYSYPFHDYEFLGDIKDEDVTQVMFQFKPFYKVIIWKFVPFIKYAEYNNHYPFTRIVSNHCYNSEEAVINNKGYEMPAVKSASIKNAIFSNIYSKRNDTLTYKTDSITASYVDRIIQLAKMNGSIVTIYYAPIYNGMKLRYNNYDKFTEAIRNKAADFDCEFYNFNDDSVCNDSSYFNDGTHLNMKGANHLSIDLSKTVKN